MIFFKINNPFVDLDRICWDFIGKPGWKKWRCSYISWSICFDPEPENNVYSKKINCSEWKSRRTSFPIMYLDLEGDFRLKFHNWKVVTLLPMLSQFFSIFVTLLITWVLFRTFWDTLSAKSFRRSTHDLSLLVLKGDLIFGWITLRSTPNFLI